LGTDTPVIDPREGAVDPLAKYEDGFGGVAGSCVFGTPVLSAEPQIIAYKLNEWFQFEKPGTYEIYWNSTCVFSEASTGAWQQSGRRQFRWHRTS